MSTYVGSPVASRETGFNSKLRRTLIAASAGNILETYDFALYGALTAILAVLFFPSNDATASLLAAFGVFAVGFLGRPLGAVLFGHLGDKFGRKRALVISITMMAVTTGLIGLLPTYSQIGIVAAILLTLLRFMQGVSFGGEFAGAMTFLVEHAPASRRGLYGSWSLGSNALGMLLGFAIAGLLAAVLPRDEILAWGWRIPFLLGATAGLIALFRRLGIDETPHFSTLEQAGQVARSPVIEALRGSPRKLLTVIGLTWLAAVVTFSASVYMTTYLTVVVELPLSSALAATILGLAVVCVLQPIMGALSDRVGRKPVVIVGAVGTLTLSYPLFTVLSQGSFVPSVLALCTFNALLAMLGGPLPAMLVELGATRTRYSLLAVGYGISQAVFAGTTPIIATLLIQQTNSNVAPAIYLIISSVATLCATMTIRETYKATLE